MFFARGDNGPPELGRMIDLSQVGARFTTPDGVLLEPGMRLRVRLSHPHIGPDCCYEVRSVVREAEVLRVDQPAGQARQVAVRLCEPLHDAIDGQIVPG